MISDDTFTYRLLDNLFNFMYMNMSVKILPIFLLVKYLGPHAIQRGNRGLQKCQKI